MRVQPPPQPSQLLGMLPCFLLFIWGYFLLRCWARTLGLPYDAISLCPQPSLFIYIFYLEIPHSLLLVRRFGAGGVGLFVFGGSPFQQYCLISAGVSPGPGAEDNEKQGCSRKFTSA